MVGKLTRVEGKPSSKRAWNKLEARYSSRALNSRQGLKELQRARDAEVLALFQVLQASRLEGNSFHHNAVMNSLVKATAWQRAQAVFQQMQQVQVEADLPSYNTLSPSGDWKRSLELCDLRFRAGVSCNLIGFVALVSSLSEVWRQAAHLVESLARSAPADVQVGSALLSACERRNAWVAGMAVLGAMGTKDDTPPNRVTCNAATSACGGAGRWQLSLASSFSFRPTEVTCNALLSACEKGGEWQRALRVLRAMPCWRLSTDEISCNAGISACAKAGRWEYSLDVLDTLPGWALQPDEISYTAAISACDQKGKWLSVLRLLHGMDHLWAAPNQICLNAAISAFQSGYQWHLAVEQLFVMSDHKHFPDEQSFGSSISACRSHGQGRWALRLLQWMDQEGLANEICRAEGVESCIVSGLVLDAVKQMELLNPGQLERVLVDPDVWHGSRNASDSGENEGRYAHECESKVMCSMFELYRDDLVDLLYTKVKGKAPPLLDVKKDIRGTVKVENAVEIEAARATRNQVASPEELQKAIQTGMERRHA
ncbi:unnamed protein product [Effrenium voratum]|uniref:Pentatricopeptide repeat-containing protein, chloroplastic n=1 Tax=Effrenium voratum TaxID=2562239 RepID=A0AA36IG09_9DINO|nr:unnamed protein product [Effrenium voratum]